MFTTILIYAFIFIHLRRRHNERPPSPLSNHHRAMPLMILYPLIYTICTAPLAAGRIYALAGHTVSLGYFCAAGTMIACNGWLDVLLYASTRADIVFAEYPPGEEIGLDTFAFMGNGHSLGTVTTIEAGGHRRANSRLGKGHGRSRGGSRDASASVENLYGLDQIGIKGEVTVVVDVAEHGCVGQDRIVSGRESSRNESGWDSTSRKSVKSFEA
jgi:hypothetical protein